MKCKYLKENENKEEFDELEVCPRYLTDDECRLLLDASTNDLLELADNIQNFFNNNDDIDSRPYYYAHYKELKKITRKCMSDLKIKYDEPQYANGRLRQIGESC